MLSENIRRLRESKGLSQGELAVRLNVVRQTVSKWERGLSVPDADLLIALSEALGQPVSALLGEAVAEPKAVNLQLARQKETRRKALRGILLAVAAATALSLACLAVLGSPYLGWDLDDPEMAVAGTLLHAFEWVFVRAAPVVLVASVAGLCLVRKRP